MRDLDWSLGKRVELFLVRLPVLVAGRGWIEDAMPPTLSPVISGGSRETRTWLYAELLQLKTVWGRHWFDSGRYSPSWGEVFGGVGEAWSLGKRPQLFLVRLPV